MNTQIDYLYRDASNYKQHNSCIIAGEISDSQIETIMECLSEGEYFIPEQVGLPAKRFGELSEDDHCWMELDEYSFEHTKKKPTAKMNVNQLVENFQNAKHDGWQDVYYYEMMCCCS